jgi:hypothetical protein
LGLAVVIWALSLLSSGEPITWAQARPFTVTVSMLTLICIAFDKWLWRWKLFRGWLVELADIQGSWKATLVSDWTNPATGNRVAPIECLMVIRQSYSTLSARLYTRESSSYLVASKLIRQNDGVFQLFGVYQNNPKIELRGERSEIHFGALMLEANGDPISSLSGHYWTDRGTRGSITLSARTIELFPDYDSASKALSLS